VCINLPYGAYAAIGNFFDVYNANQIVKAEDRIKKFNLMKT